MNQYNDFAMEHKDGLAMNQEEDLAMVQEDLTI